MSSCICVLGVAWLGTTFVSARIGKYVFDHPFLIPGLITIASAVLLGFRIAPLII